MMCEICFSYVYCTNAGPCSDGHDPFPYRDKEKGPKELPKEPLTDDSEELRRVFKDDLWIGPLPPFPKAIRIY